MDIDPKDNKKDIESPPLQALFVEPILNSCLNGSTYQEILYNIQNKIIPVEPDLLKSYLFYLIEYNLISYDGLEQLYLTEEEGIELLSMISIEKHESRTSNEDIFITLERTDF